MTRDFNKHNRDDSRSSFRNRPSHSYGEERAPHAGRVRLNREMVDRGWENGAPRLHSDYRARSNGQSSRNNWRANQDTSPNAPGGNRGYGTRQPNTRNNFQDAERRPNTYGHQAPRSSGANRAGADEQYYGGQRRNYRDNREHSDQREQHNPYGNRSGGHSPYRSNGPRNSGYQRDYHDNGNDRNDASPYRGERQRYNGNQGNNGSSFRSHNRPGPGTGYGRGHQVNKPEENERPRRGAGRYVHPEKEYRPRVNELRPPRQERPLHPRFLSRPEVRRAQESKRLEEYDEQFEGDYEQFDNDDTPWMASRSQQPDRGEHQPHAHTGNRHTNAQERERFVTPLPDGRVLKGPRPVQRKNAQFWTEVNDETQALMDQVHAPEHADPTDEDAGWQSAGEGQAVDAVQAPVEEPRRTRRTPGAAKRKKDETPKKPRSSGPKPSQKGYKWPTS